MFIRGTSDCNNYETNKIFSVAKAFYFRAQMSAKTDKNFRSYALRYSKKYA